MRALVPLVASIMVLVGCSDGSSSPPGAGKKPSLSQGADEFMKVYGAAESGVTATRPESKPEDKPTPAAEKK